MDAMLRRMTHTNERPHRRSTRPSAVRCAPAAETRRAGSSGTATTWEFQLPLQLVAVLETALCSPSDLPLGAGTSQALASSLQGVESARAQLRRGFRNCVASAASEAEGREGADLDPDAEGGPSGQRGSQPVRTMNGVTRERRTADSPAGQAFGGSKSAAAPAPGRAGNYAM